MTQPPPIKIRRASPAAAVPALPVFEIARLENNPEYEKLLLALLYSLGIPSSNEELKSFLKPPKNTPKITMMEQRVNYWAVENGYSGAAFICY